MGLFDSIEISASALTSERFRMDTVAENLANANTTRGADGGPYRRKGVILEEIPLSFQDTLQRATSARSPGGVQVAAITEDQTPARQVFNPQHPDADAAGFISLPNINPVTELVDLVSASRSYEANATALNTAKQMFQKAFEVLR